MNKIVKIKKENHRVNVNMFELGDSLFSALKNLISFCLVFSIS